MIAAREIVTRVGALPPPSGTVIRLQQLLSRESTSAAPSAAQLEKIVLYDPSLTANLLRIANSAFYRGKYPITSARGAIVRLGTTGLFEIAMGLSLKRVLPTVLPGYDIPAASFIRHGVAVGVLCERLSREIDLADRDLAFTMGLLHDVGKLVLGVYLAEHGDPKAMIREAPTRSFQEVEREVLGTDHTTVGLEIARQWRLPQLIGIGARWHHDPFRAPDEATRKSASIVHVADGLAHLLGHGSDHHGMHRRIEETVPEQLGLQASLVERLAGETLEPIEELAEALQSITE